MKDDHVAIILGRIEDKLAAFAEMMADVPKDIAEMKVRLDRLEEDNATFKAGMRWHGRELDDHEDRIAALEAA